MEILKYLWLVLVMLIFTGCSGENTEQTTPPSTPQPAPPTHNSGLPVGTIQKGTLANAKLIEDATMGVVSQAAILGIMNVIKADMFVIQMPQGEPGARHWKEKWIVTDGKTNAEINIRFQEAGLDSADWTIE